MTIAASTDCDTAPPLYRILLGTQYERLLPTLQRLHSRTGRQLYRGKAEVERGRGLLSQLCAWATRLPRAGHGPIKVEIVAGDGREQWTRMFAGHAMRSRLWARDGLLCERLGLVTFGFRLSVEDTPGHGQAIVWRVARVRALGLPLPARWFDRVHAREYERDGRYRFDVAAALPLAGLLVHYKGWLDVD
ncbi:MAG: DUF4166 domain-containing protein [Lysobacter sp.]